MKLLILNYEYPPLGGGAGICSKHQAEGLAEYGHEVTVLTTWFAGEKEISESNNLRVIRLKSRRKKTFRSNPIEMFSWAIKSFRYIRNNKLYRNTDLILAHFTIPGGIVALPIKLLYKTPYYIVSHGQGIPWFNPRELFLYHLVFYLPIKWICSQASKITVLSKRRLKDLNKITRRKNRDRNYIIPNGCDIDFFSPLAKEEKSENTSILRIIYSGRLTLQKDPFTMLRAISLLKEANIPFLLEVIGDGPLRKKMELHARTYQIEDKLVFHGWLTKEKLLDKYRAAHLLLITSRDEGMSLAMLEALSVGLYTLTTRVSGSENLIHENVNGNYIALKNPEKIAAGIKEFYENKFLKNYIVPEQAHKELRKSISWQHYVEAYKQLIEK